MATDLAISVEPQACSNMLAPIKRTSEVLPLVDEFIKIPDVIILNMNNDKYTSLEHQIGYKRLLESVFEERKKIITTDESEAAHPEKTLNIQCFPWVITFLRGSKSLF